VTEQDCLDTYQEFITMLQDLQLSWLVEQVEISMVQDLSGYSEEPLLPATAPSTQAVLIKPVTGTAQARLLKLIEATERIVVETTEIEGLLVDFLAEQGERLHSPMSLRFAEDDGSVSPPIEVSSDRRQAATELRQFLQVLRQEVLAGVD
jgi:hypothetical protein